MKGDFAEVVKKDTNVLGVTRFPAEVVDLEMCNIFHQLLYILHLILYPPPPPPPNTSFTRATSVHNTGRRGQK